MFKLDLEKAEESEIKLPTSVGSLKKQGIQKSIYSTSLTTLTPLAVWITENCVKFLKKWDYQTTLHVAWETCMRVKKQQLESYVEQWTGSE